jgi:hypothetical protein
LVCIPATALSAEPINLAGLAVTRRGSRFPHFPLAVTSSSHNAKRVLMRRLTRCTTTITWTASICFARRFIPLTLIPVRLLQEPLIAKIRVAFT